MKELNRENLRLLIAWVAIIAYPSLYEDFLLLAKAFLIFGLSLFIWGEVKIEFVKTQRNALKVKYGKPDILQGRFMALAIRIGAAIGLVSSIFSSERPSERTVITGLVLLSLQAYIYASESEKLIDLQKEVGDK